jgi:1,4-dihydroxy-2-naphthoate octaprenyltransferase
VPLVVLAVTVHLRLPPLGMVGLLLVVLVAVVAAGQMTLMAVAAVGNCLLALLVLPLAIREARYCLQEHSQTYIKDKAALVIWLGALF